MKLSILCLATLASIAALPAAIAQNDVPQAEASQESYSEPQLQKFVNAYRSIVVLSHEYTPQIRAAADIEEAEALNREAQEKMLAAVNAAGLSKDEYQQIAKSLKTDTQLLHKVNKMLQKEQ